MIGSGIRAKYLMYPTSTNTPASYLVTDSFEA